MDSCIVVAGSSADMLPPRPDDDDSRLLKTFVSGAVAGAVSRTLTAPLDRVQIHLQVTGSRGYGMREAIPLLLREGGWRSFWRGNGTSVLKKSPEIAVRFVVYEKLKYMLQTDGDDLSDGRRVVAAVAAAGVAQSLVYPLTVVKIRLVLAETGAFTGMMDAARKLYHSYGWRVFYRGFVPSTVGVVPMKGLDLAAYEQLKVLVFGARPSNSDAAVVLLCGVLSCALSTLATYPLGLVRTKLQADTGGSRSLPEVLRDTAREGAGGFYRGLGANLLKMGPSVVLNYYVYEQCRDFLGARGI